MTTIKHTAFFMAIGLIGLTGMPGFSEAAEVQPNATQLACQRNIQSSAARITKMAYVTSKSHTQVDYVKGTVFDNGTFDLTYKFWYRDSDNDQQCYTLRFDYNSRGGLVEVKTIGHSSFWEPFNAIKIAGAVVEGLAKELDKK